MSTSDELKQRLKNAAAADGGEFLMALLVSEVIDPEIDRVDLQRHFAALIAPLEERMPVDVDCLLGFFREVGFGNQRPGAVDLSHSNLQWVLAQRQGLPITVASVLIEAARRCGIAAHGINYPGHFLVSIEGRVADPLSLRRLQKQEFEAKLSAEEVQDVLRPTPTGVFGLRMLNNVKIQYAQAQNWSGALDILECQLAVETIDETAQAALHFERGECLLQMEQPLQAQQAYTICLQMSPPPALAQQAERRLEQLQWQPRTLH